MRSEEVSVHIYIQRRDKNARARPRHEEKRESGGGGVGEICALFTAAQKCVQSVYTWLGDMLSLLVLQCWTEFSSLSFIYPCAMFE